MLNITRIRISDRNHDRTLANIAPRLEAVGFTDFGFERLRGGSVVWWADRQWRTPKGSVREFRSTLFCWATEDRTELFSDAEYADFVVGEIAQRLRDLGSET